MARTQCGTRYYMAPEIYLNQEYTYKADLWSVGVIIYRSILGKTLFNYIPTLEMLDPNYSFFNPSELLSFSPELTNLLEGLLQKDHHKRISFKEFSSHKFFMDSGEQDDNNYPGDLLRQAATSPRQSKTIPRRTQTNKRSSSERDRTTGIPRPTKSPKNSPRTPRSFHAEEFSNVPPLTAPTPVPIVVYPPFNTTAAAAAATTTTTTTTTNTPTTTTPTATATRTATPASPTPHPTPTSSTTNTTTHLQKHSHDL
eukprot:TRINITY_DN8309_c0_g5_i4.p1 TRINITY_DN8309_c0_g5~~TRINITY_DN8309_c0_g5_i4.p1  ORF type:complete len:255 (-),score=64.24 TRINITY_DN8309_c0_g5_i4:19-783(-)